MPRKHKGDKSSGHTILLVDDNPEYLEATRLLLEHEGHRVICALDGPQALTLLHQQPVDLLLLDYFMPGMTGEEVVTQLRQFNPYVQIILQTGYASEQPPRALLQRLDIQGYYDKSEGPEKLLLWTDVGLKAAYAFQLLYKSRQGLRYILDVTPELHRLQPLTDLLQGILLQVSGLLGAANSFLAVLPNSEDLNGAAAHPAGFLALLSEDSELSIHASTGRFAGLEKVDGCLESDKKELIGEALRQGLIQVAPASTVVPLRIGQLTLGVIFLDKPATANQDLELLQIFANQAAVAIQNTQLYEMATLDPLTGVYSRRFFDQCLLRELRAVFRAQQPLSLVMLDIDNMKRINDVAGHLAGDQALLMLGHALRQATRSTDTIGRYGGDEFAIIMPQTPSEQAEQLGDRLLALLEAKSIRGLDAELPLRTSIGMTTLEPPVPGGADVPHPVPPSYFEGMAQACIQQADAALYQAKRSGGNRACHGSLVLWPPIERLPLLTSVE